MNDLLDNTFRKIIKSMYNIERESGEDVKRHQAENLLLNIHTNLRHQGWVQSIPLANSAIDACIYANIIYVFQIALKTEREMLQYRNIGPKKIVALKAILSGLDLELDFK